MNELINEGWHPCEYGDGEKLDWGHLHHDGTWVDGRWYEWLDKHGNREVARMKMDAQDHFWPPTKIITEEDVVAFREIRYDA